MSTVLVRCMYCSTQYDIPAASLLLDQQAATVSWICLTCGDVLEQGVLAKLVEQLVRVGALVVTYDTIRTPHPESPPAGPPLTPDDLLEMHQLLEQPTWFAQVQVP